MLRTVVAREDETHLAAIALPRGTGALAAARSHAGSRARVAEFASPVQPPLCAGGVPRHPADER